MKSHAQEQTSRMPFLVMVIIFSLFPYTVQAGSGNCNEYQELYVDRSGKIERTQPLIVIEQGALLYQNATSRNVYTAVNESGSKVPVTLNFGNKLKAVKQDGSRIQVKRISSSEPLGWMEGSDLLCAVRPSKGMSGLEKKLFIKTPAAVHGTVAVVNAYPSSNQIECSQQRCRQLSRWRGYFIVDEENGRYLLSDEYDLNDTSVLVGWVDEEDGFLWETAYALRPKEKPIKEGSKINSGKEKIFCIYPTFNDALSNRNCQEFLGGNDWFASTHRIPVLEREGEFYKVAVPATGVAAEKDGNAVHIKLSGDNEGIKSLLNMKKVDIFFLVDGTSSMGPYINAVKDVAGEIINKLSKHELYGETNFRFGYRIYRDDYAGNKGIGEGLSLSSQCSTTDGVSLTELKQRFELSISQVKVSSNEKDDYEENLFGGLKQAVIDISPCPDNTKLLFIIGDHGYSAEKQRERGRQPVDMSSLMKGLSGDVENGVKNIVTFFIQTPKNPALFNTKKSYRQAYERFTRQARKILEGTLGDLGNGDAEIANFLLTTNDSELTSKIIGGVKTFSRADIINEIVLDLDGGSALDESINRLKKLTENKDIPIIFWDNIKNGSCKHLGKQCEDKIYDAILEGYLPVSDDFEVDVWLKTEDLYQWTQILSLIGDIKGLSSTKQRTAFGIAINESLRQVIGGFLPPDRPMIEYIDNLPVRDNSPLFNYDIDSLMDREKVPDCEISRLIHWVHNSLQMLNVVSLGTRQPEYTEEPYPGDCHRSDGSNIPIPYIGGAIQQSDLGPTDNYRFDHLFQKVRIFWVPKEYLP